MNRARLEQAAGELGLTLNVAERIKGADMFVTSKNYYRRKLPKVREAEEAGLPIYVLKSTTPHQIRQLLGSVFTRSGNGGKEDVNQAIHEAEEAVRQVEAGEEEVELSPQSAYIRRLQHLIAERHNLASRSEGREPGRRVRIYR